jgi:hypothetical protein
MMNNMTLIKKQETWVHQETGIQARIDSNGSVTFLNSRGQEQFIFRGSSKETVVKVADALTELASKMKLSKKQHGKKS